MTSYRTVGKKENTIVLHEKANDVALWFLGKQLGSYWVIKSDDQGDRLIDMTKSTSSDIRDITQYLLDA